MEMAYDKPELLLLLLFPAFLAVAQLWRPGASLTLPVDDVRSNPDRADRVLAALASVVGLLPPAILAAAILILAGPRRLETVEDVATVRNVVVCLDVSYSMEDDFAPDLKRYDAALKAVDAFASRCRGTAFGLVVFGASAIRWVPPTRDLDVIQRAPPFLRPKTLPRELMGSTDIEAGVRTAAIALRADLRRDNLIILITDGEDNSGLSPESARGLAEELRYDRIKLHVVHVGLPVIPALMDILAGQTGGLAQPALEPSTLQQVLDDIGRLHKVSTKIVRTVRVNDSGLLAWVGLGLTFLYAASLLGLRYTPW